MKWKCPICGLQFGVHISTTRIECFCGYVQLNGVYPGMGDMVAIAFLKVGITKERYAKAKSILGYDSSCDCLKRQQSLNEFGKKLGIGISADSA
jgi:hypothetical protein